MCALIVEVLICQLRPSLTVCSCIMPSLFAWYGILSLVKSLKEDKMGDVVGLFSLVARSIKLYDSYFLLCPV